MAFRAEEQAAIGREGAIDYFLKNIPATDRKRSQTMLDDLISEFGPVVQSYPSWHPLMTGNRRDEDDDRSPQTRPGPKSGYEGLDHTIYLRHAFITCPYSGGQTVITAVKKLRKQEDAEISAEKLDAPLYHSNATPVLVKCEWGHDMEFEGTIPKRVAVGLYLEQEVRCWRWAQVAETWENMRHYILGAPRGSKSSLFVSQETGNALKQVHTVLIRSGMFGPVYE